MLNLGIGADALPAYVARRFGITNTTLLESVVSRGQQASAAAALQTGLEDDERLRAGQIRRADTACTRWRYDVVIDLTAPDWTGARQEHMVLTADTAQSRNDLLGSAAQLVTARQLSGTTVGSRKIPAEDFTVSNLRYVAVARSC